MSEAEQVEARVAGLSKAVGPKARLGQPQQAFGVETGSIVPEQGEALAEAGSVTNIRNSLAGRDKSKDRSGSREDEDDDIREENELYIREEKEDACRMSVLSVLGLLGTK